MKARKVIVSLEMKSDRPLRLLKMPFIWQEVMDTKFAGTNKIHQITASVVKENK